MGKLVQQVTRNRTQRTKRSAIVPTSVKIRFRPYLCLPYLRLSFLGTIRLKFILPTLHYPTLPNISSTQIPKCRHLGHSIRLDFEKWPPSNTNIKWANMFWALTRNVRMHGVGVGMLRVFLLLWFDSFMVLGFVVLWFHGFMDL